MRMLNIVSRVLFLIFVLSDFVAFASLPDIVALVNDEPITRHDFLARKNLIVTLNNISASDPSYHDRLNTDVLKIMIDEAIIRQHASKIGGKTSDLDIASAIASIEERNKMQPGALIPYIKSKNVDVDSFYSQISAEIIKQKIFGSISHSVSVSSTEVDNVIIDNTNQNFLVEFSVITSKKPSDLSFNIMEKLRLKISNEKKLRKTMYQKFATVEKISANYRDLDQKMQMWLRDIDEEQTSSVFKDEGKCKLIFVHKKPVNSLSDQADAQVKNFVFNQNLSRLADKFIRDLRNKSFIKIFLPRYIYGD